MADIIESIHRINYEINDASLQRATASIVSQLNELIKLNDELSSLRQQLAKTTSLQAGEFQKISDNVNKTSNLLELRLGRLQQLLGQVGSGLLKGLGVDLNLESAVEKWTSKVRHHLAGFAKGGDVASGAIAGVLKTLGSSGNIVSVAVSVLTSLVDIFFATSENADRASEGSKKFLEVQKMMAEDIGREIGQLNTLYITATNTTLAYEQRLKAVEELQRKFPDYFGQLERETILNGEAQASYDRLTESIVKRAKANALQKALETTLAEKFQAEAELDRLLHPEPGTFAYATEDEIDEVREKIRGTEALIKRLSASIQTANEDDAFTYVYSPDSRNGFKDDQPKQSDFSLIRETKKGKSKTKPEIEKLSARNIEIAAPETIEIKAPEKGAAPEVQFPEIYFPSKLQSFLFGDTADIEEPEERRREQIEKSIDAYQTLVNAAAQAFQQIYDAQVKALDAEIAIRQKRVDAAMKLAEKGNTDALKIEQERLEKAQKQREEYARRQQIINAALAVSNAVLAVAQAAGETGPGAIAVVPAVIAAIVAGYAAISAATRESTAQAFADGVVNYRGKGGPRDDANWVRISSGESIITASGTAGNRHILEAINSGAQFRMIDPRINAELAYLKAPVGIQGGFASQTNLKSLEKKLDSVIEAVQDNQLKQDIFFNEHGVGLMTQKAMRREQNRFR